MKNYYKCEFISSRIGNYNLTYEPNTLIVKTYYIYDIIKFIRNCILILDNRKKNMRNDKKQIK